MFLWGRKYSGNVLTKEDMQCLKMWDDYIILERLPHELGLTPEAYPEDIESIKQMKKWYQQREQREAKKQADKERTLAKVRSMHGSG